MGTWALSYAGRVPRLTDLLLSVNIIEYLCLFLEPKVRCSSAIGGLVDFGFGARVSCSRSMSFVDTLCFEFEMKLSTKWLTFELTVNLCQIDMFQLVVRHWDEPTSSFVSSGLRWHWAETWIWLVCFKGTGGHTFTPRKIKCWNLKII